MRIYHLGQHPEFYIAEDIYDLCFALALVSTPRASGNSTSMHFALTSGNLRHVAEVLRSGVVGFACDRGGYVNHADLRWNSVSLPNMADAPPPQQCCQLRGYAVSRGGRHGAQQRDGAVRFEIDVLEPMIQ